MLSTGSAFHVSTGFSQMPKSHKPKTSFGCTQRSKTSMGEPQEDGIVNVLLHDEYSHMFTLHIVRDDETAKRLETGEESDPHESRNEDL